MSLYFISLPRLVCRNLGSTAKNIFHIRANSPLKVAAMDQFGFAESFSTSLGSAGDGDGKGPGVILEQPEGKADLQHIQKLIENALKVESQPRVSVITVEKAVTAVCEALDDLKVDEERHDLMKYLSRQTIDRDVVTSLSMEYSRKSEDGDSLILAKLEEQLRNALVPRYIGLLKRIGQLEGGVKFLVDFRAHLISCIKSSANEDGETLSDLKLMNNQLRQILSHWFSAGFLELNLVTWESPCALLQKISDYEAVHPIRNWTDLKARVGPYRRCFVYTHRSMPGEPIVVLHVALTKDIPHSISSVVKNHRLVKRFSVDTINNPSSGYKEGEDPTWCECAIFYSITSTQSGLQGIELGTYLIKHAVRKLKEELAWITHFSTLSPIPGFRSWLITELKNEHSSYTTLLEGEVKELSEIYHCEVNEVLSEFYPDIQTNGWTREDRKIEAFEPILMRLCAKYLYLEKRRGLAFDGVANFHLRNGAVLWRLNWCGDLSARGLTNSCGIMVNYKYFLDDLETNSTDYQEKQIIKTTDLVKNLAEKH